MELVRPFWRSRELSTGFSDKTWFKDVRYSRFPHLSHFGHPDSLSIYSRPMSRLPQPLEIPITVPCAGFGPTRRAGFAWSMSTLACIWEVWTWKLIHYQLRIKRGHWGVKIVEARRYVKSTLRPRLGKRQDSDQRLVSFCASRNISDFGNCRGNLE